MTVKAYGVGDVFTFRVTKHHSANPDRQWANSYEFRATGDGTEGDLLDLATQLVLFEEGIHGSFTTFDRVLISTWQPDSVPYDPDTFITSTLTGTGAIGSFDNASPLNQTMRVARPAATGRAGHLFYRGCLLESDIDSPAGTPVLVTKAALQTRLDNALETSLLALSIGSAADGEFQMVLVGDDPTKARLVLQLTVQGVTTLPLDHAWFNRRTITVP